MKTPIYPTWEEVKDELPREELIDIIDEAIYNPDSPIVDIMDEVIASIYEPIRYEVDADFYYDDKINFEKD